MKVAPVEGESHQAQVESQNIEAQGVTEGNPQPSETPPESTENMQEPLKNKAQPEPEPINEPAPQTETNESAPKQSETTQAPVQTESQPTTVETEPQPAPAQMNRRHPFKLKFKLYLPKSLLRHLWKLHSLLNWRISLQ